MKSIYSISGNIVGRFSFFNFDYLQVYDKENKILPIVHISPSETNFQQIRFALNSDYMRSYEKHSI